MKNQKSYRVELFLIFVTVLSAFALNSWNENRKANLAENKLLAEIQKGLEKDLLDIDENLRGHHVGNQAVDYFRHFLLNKPINQDSLVLYYLSVTRDFISIQNVSGYETLKSRGFELIQNDSLRTKIISLYEYDYSSLRKLEEEYYEMQFQENYFREINRTLAKYFIFDGEGKITGIAVNQKVDESEKRILLSYLMKIKTNRTFAIYQYGITKAKVFDLIKNIERYNGH